LFWEFTRTKVVKREKVLHVFEYIVKNLDKATYLFKGYTDQIVKDTNTNTLF